MNHPAIGRISALPFAALLFVALLAPASADAQSSRPRAPAPLQVVELAIETAGAGLVLPAGGIGNVTVVPCAGCKPQTLLIGSQSRLTLDGQSVGALELRRALLSQPDSSVALFYRRGSTEITRILVVSPPESARRPASRTPGSRS